MLFKAPESLESFIDGIGHNIFLYRGTSRFEALLTGFFCHNIWRESDNFMFAPNIDQSTRAILELSAIRFTTMDRGESTITVFGGDFNEESGHLLRDAAKIHPLLDRKNPLGDIAIHDSPELPISVDLNKRLANAMGRPAPYTLDALLQGCYRSVVTTDWRTFVEARMFGLPAFLISGPHHPTWLKTISSPQCFQSVKDVIAYKACPCLSTDRCHDSSQKKPCMTHNDWAKTSAMVISALC